METSPEWKRKEKDHFYFQDDLGSPMRIADEMGRSEETYGFDEFGNSIECSINAVTNPMQTFWFYRISDG